MPSERAFSSFPQQIQMILFNFQYINSQRNSCIMLIFFGRQKVSVSIWTICAAFRMMQEEAVRLCMDGKEK